MILWRAPSRVPLLYPPTKTRVSSRLPHRGPPRGTQSDPPTNIRVRSSSYQPARRGPNTPCTLLSIGRYKSRLTMMIYMTMTEAMLTGMPVPVGEQPEASTLAGPRGPVVDLSWRYLSLPFSLGNFCKNEFSKSCNYLVFLLSDTAIVCYL